ncbi:sensor histidine kinase [Massilia sp. TWR1-2-2]|uniref:sensor histidine kinase n=1 Tax=Massilia sp. TWR1-2-2 TaxID=2804584 RepID=UPI003CED8B53
MKLSASNDRVKANDLIVMVPLGIATGIAFCLAFGRIPTWQWLTADVVFQAAYLWWASKRFSATGSLKNGVAFALRIQAQAAIQVATILVYVLLLAAVLDAMSGVSIRAMGNALAEGDNLALLLFGMAKSIAAVSIGLSWSRVYTFGQKRLNLRAVADGSYYRKVVLLPASREVASQVLVRYLERLTHEATTRYRRFFYDAHASVTVHDLAGHQFYTLQWTMCPVRIRIAVVGLGPAAVELHVTGELRGGHYRTELFANPLEVQSIHAYLQTHLFQPLISEFALSTAVTRQDELRHQAIESQLRILQAQIEPHFLFNTLANVRHLYRSGVDAGEEMMDHLIVYLRSTLEDLRSDASTVGKEMDLILHYLAIMKIRMGDRLSYGFIIPDALSQHAFPPAMLISLVENSIMHGLHDRASGKLTISCEREGQHLRVTVADNGAGFSSVEGTGVGLSNIRQRLEAMYGSRAWLEVGALAEGGFTSSVMVPFEG